MKLVHPDLEMQLLMDEKTVPVIVVENREYCFKMLNELHCQTDTGDGSFVLSHNEKILDMQKRAMLFMSPWDMNFENKKITAKLLSLAHDIAADENSYEKTAEIKSRILQYIGDVAYSMPVAVDYDLDFDITELFKMCHLKIDTQGLSLQEKMMTYMQIWDRLFGETCFIFYAFRNFLSSAVLSEFYREALAEKLKFIMIEGCCEDKTDEEKLYIIDKDLCCIF